MTATFAKKLEDMFAAAAFAEEGEFDTAREILGAGVTVLERAADISRKVTLTVEELHAMVATFAEAGDFETAERILRELQEIEARLERDRTIRRRKNDGALSPSQAGL